MKIGIDTRLGKTKVSSGLGRATRNLVDGLLEFDKENEYVLLTGSNQQSERPLPSNVTVVKTHYGLFTKDDFFLTPVIAKEERIDVFVSPQFYMPSLYQCRNVKIVHDLWALLHPEWLPSKRDFVRIYGETGYQGVAEITHYFLGLHKKGLIFPRNQFLSDAVRRLNEDSAQLGAIARMAFTLLTATEIVAVSQFVKKQIVDFFPEVTAKVHVIHNFLSPSFLLGQTGERQNYLLHVSKWEPRKNIELAVEGTRIARVRFGIDCNLLLVGNDKYSMDYRTRIMGIISKGSYGNFISHVGVVDDTELHKLYREAFALICPSLNEGFGYPVLEAMACGTPVIATNLTSLPEICKDAVIYIDSKKPRSLAEAIHFLYTNGKEYKRLSERGLKRSNFFDRTSILKSFMSLISSVSKKPYKNPLLHEAGLLDKRFMEGRRGQ